MIACPCCESITKFELINLGKQPFANKYPSETNIEFEQLNDLSIQICNYCYTASTNSIASRETMFEEYFYLSSINHELVEHFNILAKKIPPSTKLLDVGSNDGIFLRPLLRNGVKAIGIDPSENVGRIANENGLKTIIGFFDDKNTQQILDKFGKFDYVVASSIFTHVEDPIQFIKNLKKIIKDTGQFILEIEYVKNIVSNIEFERFYFDRPFYYSIKGIKKIFEKFDLHINEIEDISPHGGSLRFIISKNKYPSNPYVEKLLKNEDIFFKQIFKSSFQNIAFKEAQKFKDYLILQNDHKKKVIAFGCPARFSTLTNFINIDSSLLPYVIDDSPIKQNKLSPGKHIQIKDRGFLEVFKPEIIIVFAYEYFNSIYDYTKKFNAKHFKPVPLTKLD